MSTVNSLAKLEYAQIRQVKWLLGGLMALIGLAGVYTLGIGAAPLVTVALLAITTALVFPRWPRALPGWVWKAVTPVLIVVVVTDFVLAAGDILTPLVRMIVLLTTLRALQERRRREDLQLLLLALFLVVSTGVLSMALSFAFQLILFTPVALFVLFLVNLSENYGPEAETDPETWRHFQWSAVWRYLVGLLNPRMVLLSCLLFFGLTAVATVLFISLPRFEFGQQLPFARLTAENALTGLSEDVVYGDIVNLQNDETIAMRVDVGGNTDRPALPYWRMLVLDELTDDGFRTSRGLLATYQFRDDSTFRGDGTFGLGRGATSDQTWTFYYEGGVSRYLPLPGPFETLLFQNSLTLASSQPSRTMRLQQPQANVLFFRLEGLAPERPSIPATPREAEALQNLLAGTASTSEANLYPGTTLLGPNDTGAREALARWVAEIRQGETMGPNAFIARATAFLQNRRGYSLNVEVPAADWTNNRICRWVDAGLDGHCELYAGALVLLARQAGIPARLVTGFAGGDWNAYEGYFMVRNRDAHAWVEFYDPASGWVRTDPTPGQSATRDATGTNGGRQGTVDQTWDAYLDSLRVLWYRRVVSFDRAQQEAMIQDVREGVVGLGGQFRAWFGEIAERFKAWWQAKWDGPRIVQLTLQLGLIAALGLGLRTAWRAWKSRQPRKERHLAPERRRAGTWLRRLEGLDAREIAVQEVRTELQTIRYGHPETWPTPKATYRRARHVLRAEAVKARQR